MALALVGCAGEPETTAPPAEPADNTVEGQYRAALAGAPDAEVAAIAEKIDSALDDDARASLATLDLGEVDAEELLQHEGFMGAWGVIAVELSGMTPLHAVDQPDCRTVEEALEGWSAAAGATAFEITGSSVAGSHAAAAVIFIAKKNAQSFRVPMHRAFDHANECALAYETEACGMPGEACCDGACAGGTTCLGGLCL